MLNQKLFHFLSLCLTIALFGSGLLNTSVHAAVEDMSPGAQEAFTAATAEDGEALAGLLEGKSAAEVVALAREFAANTEGETRNQALTSLAAAAMKSVPTDEVPGLAANLMRTITQSSGGDANAVRAGMEGIINGTRNNPGMEDADPDTLNALLNNTGNQAAAAAISVAQDTEGVDIEEVAGGIAGGGVSGLGRIRDTDSNQLTALVNGMAEGGVGAASMQNRVPVSRAMLRAAARVTPPKMRNRASQAMISGAGAGGGQQIANSLQGYSDTVDGGDTQPPQVPVPANPIEPEDVSGF